ncbi:hypothetical protein MASR2M78_14760 [Treponema sp.]
MPTRKLAASACSLLFCFLALISTPVGAQQRINDTIPIAIPDARPFGVDILNEDQARAAEAYTALIMTEVSNIPYFEVLERKQANEIYEEIAYQLQTGGAITDTADLSLLRGARAILITGFGELFERIIITARLVDLQTGRVLFAETIYSDRNSIQQAMTALSASMREKGSELGLLVSVEDIEKAVAVKSWKDAKRLADIYLRGSPGNERVRELYEMIAANRAKELHSDSRRLVRLKLFKEARIAIDEAIALFPRSEYYAYRDTIGQAELDYQYSQRAAQQRRDEALKTGKARQGFWRLMTDHLNAVSVSETRLGASYATPLIISEDLEIDEDNGDWGFDIAWLNAHLPQGGRSTKVWSWYAGLYGGYERVHETGRGAVLSAYLSPLSAQSFRLGPLVLHLGLDAGPFMGYGPYEAESLQYGLSLGGMAELGLRFSGRTGVFTAIKADWREYLSKGGENGPILRLIAGITL